MHVMLIPCYNVMNVANGDLYIYAKHKVTKVQYCKLQDILDGMSFPCGSVLSELLGDEHDSLPVYVKDLTCEDLIEKLYFSIYRT